VVGLLAVALVWGATFSAIRHAIEAMPTTDFLAVRVTLAALVMLALRPSTLLRVRAATLRHGVALGVLLAAAYLTQAVGLETTTAGVAGVLTGLVVVLAAVVAAAVARAHVPARLLAALGLGAVGVGILAARSAGLRSGEVLVLVGALVLAVHLVVLAQVAELHDLWTLTAVQLVTAATLLAALAAPDGIVAPPDLGVWGDVALAGVLATAGAYLVQTWAQRRVDPARVGLLLATEPAFAVLVAVWLAGESLTWPLVLAAVAIVAAVVVVELRSPAETSPA
jgi:drug/metabolite transporter (DMT)-like permease